MVFTLSLLFNVNIHYHCHLLILLTSSLFFTMSLLSLIVAAVVMLQSSSFVRKTETSAVSSSPVSLLLLTLHAFAWSWHAKCPKNFFSHEHHCIIRWMCTNFAGCSNFPVLQNSFKTLTWGLVIFWMFPVIFLA